MSIALYFGCRPTSLRADCAGPVVIWKLLVFYRGMSIVRSSSAWDLQQINDFLHAAVIPIRLACSDKEGVPLICSLWYLYADNALWCATQQSASVATLLERTPKCAFEVAPESMPYRGVRGQGRVTVMPDEGAATLQQLIDRYLGARDTEFATWLISRSANEVALKIEPEWITSWDFGSRMRD
jgi:nitroimidazol reductase NimA-like FMN-containing flavoprotein (pyridoxamine 5'-phosphate oxidase superfamily)